MKVTIYADDTCFIYTVLIGLLLPKDKKRILNNSHVSDQHNIHYLVSYFTF